MDGLIESFHRFAITTYNPSPFEIEFIRDTLFSRSFIPQNTLLCEMFGEHEYTWDISFQEVHSKYLILTEDFALDVSKEQPRNIFSYIRYCTESITPTAMPNCQFHLTQDHSMTRIFLYTSRDICVNEELIYEVDTDS